MSGSASGSTMMISIVVPSIRSLTIGHTIEAILNQTDRDWELIISDQSGNDHLAKQLPHWKDPRIRLVRCPGRGASLARNVGILHSKSDLIAFTDDDCCPRHDWVAMIRELFAEDPDLWMATGSILPPLKMPPRPCVCPGYVPEERKSRPSEGGAPIYSVTANAAYQRIAFNRAGPFDVCLSPGTEFCGGEESDHGVRMALFNPILMQTPRMEVEHTYGVRSGAKAAWNIKRNYAIASGAVAAKENAIHANRQSTFSIVRQVVSGQIQRRSIKDAVRGLVRAYYIYRGYRRLTTCYEVDEQYRLLKPRGSEIKDLYHPIASLLNYQLPAKVTSR